MDKVKKIKILVLSDHPLSPSGVGIQTKYMIESLLKTGRYKFVCFGGAMKHPNYDPVKTEEYGDDWIIFPVDGYGSPDMIRSVMRTEKPDILWFMTDPRFYEWLWGIENEIRPNVPMVYYHVWDNYPYPKYNNKFYDSNDVIACISKVTHDIVSNVSPQVESHYLPHSIDTNVFKKYNSEEIKQFYENTPAEEDKFLCFWNNRNARRKQSGSLIWWWSEFLEKIGKDNATLLMHTDPRDDHGQDLQEIISRLDLTEKQILLSMDKVPPDFLAKIYNAADCTINISDAEGFGLATFESLACETPIIVNMTGGLQEQVTDGENWFGVGIKPSSRAIIGSQQVPYIYEDRINNEDFVGALEKMYYLWKDNKEEYKKMGHMGRQHVLKNYNFEEFGKRWDELLTNVHEKYGSWENRKGYKNWEIIEVQK